MDVEIVYENRWFEIHKRGHYHYMNDRSGRGGAVILAIKDRNVIFVRSKRPAHNVELLELPRGGRDERESFEGCALREFLEETGYRGEIKHLKRLGSVRPETALSNSCIPVFLLTLDKDSVAQTVSCLLYTSDAADE